MTAVPSYNILRVIGSGCFGYVFEAVDRKSKEKVAMKRIYKVTTQLSRYYEILYLIKDCENVVKILVPVLPTQNFFYSRNEEGKLIQNIVLEYVEDNLENLIGTTISLKEKIPEPLIKNYIYQLLNGLKGIHSKNIAHRDLKPENVLLSQKGVIKICDFGSSKVIDKKGKNTPYIVSRYYRAPYLILCITRYSTAIDIWAVGCILAELYLLKPFFKGETEGDQLFAIFRTMGSFSPHEISAYKYRVPFDPSLLDAFGSFKKANLKDIFKDSEDKNNLLDLLDKLLTYLPEYRLTAEQAMQHHYFSSEKETGLYKDNKYRIAK